MKKSDKIAIKDKSPQELSSLLSGLKKELVENKAKHRLGNLKDTSVFRKINYQLSLITSLLSATVHDQPKSTK